MAGQPEEDKDFMSGLLGGIEALVAEPIWNLFDRGRQGAEPPEPLFRQRSSSAEGRCLLCGPMPDAVICAPSSRRDPIVFPRNSPPRLDAEWRNSIKGPRNRCGRA